MHRDFFENVSGDSSVRVIVMSAQGKLFTAGLDISDQRIFKELFSKKKVCIPYGAD